MRDPPSGLAYLDRYEALGAAGIAAVIVLGASYQRSQGRFRLRLMTASADVTVFLAPLVATFVAWAVMSYVITGQAFPGISSQYGTGAQTSESVHMTFAVRAAHGLHNVEYLAPLLPIVLVLAVFFAVRRRDLRIFAPLAILGGSVIFDTLGLFAGFLEPWYRYFIVSVPLDVMLVGCILAQGGAAATTSASASAAPSGTASSDERGKGKAVAGNAIGIVMVVALLGVSVPLAGKGIFASSVQSSESTSSAHCSFLTQKD